jgi:3-hydroxyacyl-CoA dehydrogenase
MRPSRAISTDVIIASSSSGLTMSEIQKGAASHPERCVIGHPFNPPHLIPLVEIVGGAKTSETTIRRAVRPARSGPEDCNGTSQMEHKQTMSSAIPIPSMR